MTINIPELSWQTVTLASVAAWYLAAGAYMRLSGTARRIREDQSLNCDKMMVPVVTWIASPVIFAWLTFNRLLVGKVEEKK